LNKVIFIKNEAIINFGNEKIPLGDTNNTGVVKALSGKSWWSEAVYIVDFIVISSYLPALLKADAVSISIAALIAFW